MTIAAVAFALFAWWFGTGVVLYVDRLPSETHPRTGLVFTLLAGVAFFGLIWSAFQTTWVGAYVAFISALAVWGWHELTFLLGWLTGPRRTPCPPNVSGWKRFRLATEVVIHHELALAGTALLVLGLTYGGPNRVGSWTFLVLWLMRISAKLNVFLGVRNLTEDFIPHHLGYMKSYFRRRLFNPLMPISLILSLTMVGILAHIDLDSGQPSARAGTTLVTTLLALAVLEHVFLVLPVPDALLWRWAVRAADEPTR